MFVALVIVKIDRYKSGHHFFNLVLLRRLVLQNKYLNFSFGTSYIFAVSDYIYLVLDSLAGKDFMARGIGCT